MLKQTRVSRPNDNRRLQNLDVRIPLRLYKTKVRRQSATPFHRHGLSMLRNRDRRLFQRHCSGRRDHVRHEQLFKDSPEWHSHGQKQKSHRSIQREKRWRDPRRVLRTASKGLRDQNVRRIAI